MVHVRIRGEQQFPSTCTVYNMQPHSGVWLLSITGQQWTHMHTWSSYTKGLTPLKTTSYNKFLLTRQELTGMSEEGIAQVNN